MNVARWVPHFSRVFGARSGGFCASSQLCWLSKALRFSKREYKKLRNVRTRLSRLFPRIFPAIGHLPSLAVIRRLLPCLLNLIRADPNDPHTIENSFSIRAAARPLKLRRSGRHFPLIEDVHTAFVVGEHSIPTVIIRTVREHGLAAVVSRAIPAFDDHALIERELDLACSRRRSTITHRPISQPVIELPTLATGARFRIVRICNSGQHHRNGRHQKTTAYDRYQKIRSFVHRNPTEK